MSQNSDIIHLLPDSVANQIAAGEVIQRPASVIKELVENAVDAGASRISIILRDAGRTLIQVIDNGSGMSETDARMAFERHATSKITAAADLFELHTMGFRGEALASIAAVSQVDLRTMLHGDTIGSRLVINGSMVESQEPEACAPGTNMMVKNLFFNVPARRKFLKKDSVELNNILREFERLALVNPDIELSISHNDTLLHQLMRAPLKRRIADLFGKSLEQQLIPVDTDTSIVRISGFIGLPENARKRNALQYLFVNGRNMRHPYFHKAIMSCYEGIISPDQQPNYFISFNVDPQTIDVNIHPTKHEIKFENESAIWQMLVAAVRESLGRFNAAGAIDFDVTDAPDIPAFSPDSAGDHSIDLDPDYNPFAQPTPSLPADDDFGSTFSPGANVTTTPPRSFGSHERQSSINTRDWEKLYADFTSRRDAPLAPDEQSPAAATTGIDRPDDRPDDSGFLPGLDSPEQPVGDGPRYIQLQGRYILSAGKSGLMVVDQHRAHLRILFERYLAASAGGQGVSQQVMFPEVIELQPSMSALMRSIADDLRHIGFDIAFLGGASWSVNATPALLEGTNARDTLMAILADIADIGRDTRDHIPRSIALAMARSSAIKPGQQLSHDEMSAIMTDLLQLPAPDYTPDGRLIIRLIPTDDIARQF